jgi:hypothetical protein
VQVEKTNCVLRYSIATVRKLTGDEEMRRGSGVLGTGVGGTSEVASELVGVDVVVVVVVVVAAGVVSVVVVVLSPAVSLLVEVSVVLELSVEVGSAVV